MYDAWSLPIGRGECHSATDRHVPMRRCRGMWSGRSSIIDGSYTHTSWRCGRCDVCDVLMLAVLLIQDQHNGMGLGHSIAA